ncbi:MAG TPA: TMEM175 family protein [Candidatus Eisenbacteria bacterium]|nr:TMEM175 family protein [Candidatus Eisenbacteria bacterium]
MTEGTSRMDAFSDGVFAIAVTLLILEIRLPHAGAEGALWKSLVALWPSYFAFAFSFFVILVTWITHHDLMRLVRATNRPVQLANGCALLYVTFIPFPTAVLAANLAGADISTAVAFYCGTFVFGSAAFNLLVATIARGQLFRPEVNAQTIGRIRRGYRITFGIYLAATLIALVAPWLALALNIAVRLHLLRIRYQPALPATRPEVQLTRERG